MSGKAHEIGTGTGSVWVIPLTDDGAEPRVTLNIEENEVGEASAVMIAGEVDELIEALQAARKRMGP